MNKFIATTTINKATKALIKYADLKDWTLVIAGDINTPDETKSFFKDFSNVVYLTPEDQRDINPKLSDLIGFKCIQRRNFAILYSYLSGADYIAVVDDDNIPLENWGKILLKRPINVHEYSTSDYCFDPLFTTDHSYLWHRGFPLERVHCRDKFLVGIKKMNASIQANLWNGNPDIDAVARHIYNPTQLEFKDIKVYTSDKIMPFNSQNIILSREVIKDYFLFPDVGRMDDIWASFFVQAVGHKVIFGEATVFQERNEHNINKDMILEYSGYEKNYLLIQDLIKSAENIYKYLPEKAVKTFDIWRAFF